MQAARGTSLSEDAAERATAPEPAADDRSGSSAAPEGTPGPDASYRPRPARRSPAITLAVVCLVWLGLDVLSKELVVAHLKDRAPLRVLGGLFNLVYARNSGAAFSFAQGQTVLLSIVAIVVVVAIARFARRLNSLPWAVCLGLILGGALGNLADRIFRDPAPFRGAVVDWISLTPIHGYIWPTFNIADSGLVIGVITAVVLEIAGVSFDGSRRRGASR